MRGYSGPLAAVQPRSALLLNGVLEDLAGAEFRLRRGLDLHRLAGARVAPGRSLAAGDREIAEADQPDLVAALQRRR